MTDDNYEPDVIVSCEPVLFDPHPFDAEPSFASGSLTTIPIADHRATQPIPRESMRELVYGDRKRDDDTAPHVPLDLVAQEKRIAAAMALTVSDGASVVRRPTRALRETWFKRGDGRWGAIRRGGAR